MGAIIMQRRMAAILLMTSLFVVAAEGADEPADGPKTIFRDDLMDKLAGDWTLTRSIRGLKVENTVKAEWVLNHQFLRLHMKDVKEPATYEAIVFIGYRHADKEYVCHWLDVFGGKFSAMAKGKRKGDSIEFIFHYDDGPFRNTFTWHPKADGWNFHMENQAKDGTWKLFADDDLRRP
jgi:hypothetical protein